MQNPKYFFLIAAAVLSLSGCAHGPSARMFERSFFVMGTVCDIKVFSSDPVKAQRSLEKIYETLKHAEAEYNFYGKNSRISVINEQAGRGYARLSEDEAAVIKRSLELSDLTHGAFDITFNPLWELWKKCGKEGRLPTEKEISLAKKSVGYKNIIFAENGRSIRFASKGIKINLGGIAKGIALLDCKDAAGNNGIDNLLVNLGGDILALGKGKKDGWLVAVQDPFDPDKTVKKIRVSDKMVLTSGIYQRYVTIKGKKYHHIIDANTGFPAGDFASVTLISDADRESYVPSLAVFLMGKDKAAGFFSRNPELKYCIITEDGKEIGDLRI